MNYKIKIDYSKNSSSNSNKNSPPNSPSPKYLSPRTQEYNSKYKCYAPMIKNRKIKNNSNFEKFILDNN